MSTKAPKKRNPQDTTMRNINALKRRVAKLERGFDRLIDICIKIPGFGLAWAKADAKKKGKRK